MTRETLISMENPLRVLIACAENARNVRGVPLECRDRLDAVLASANHMLALLRAARDNDKD